MMRPREIVFATVAVVGAAVCVRLGFWQLERLDDRRAYNARVLARLDSLPVPLEEVGQPRNWRYRRVVVSGRYDLLNEIVVTQKPRDGSPGVHVATPLFPDGSDTAVLVVRGWLYAADATRADLEAARESRAHGEVGYVEMFDIAPPRRSSAPGARTFRRLIQGDVSRAFPYLIAGFYVVLMDTADAGAAATRRAPGMPPPATPGREGLPRRLSSPALGEGPHFGYAVQWFSFAAIALVGGFFFIRHGRRPREQVTDIE